MNMLNLVNKLAEYMAIHAKTIRAIIVGKETNQQEYICGIYSIGRYAWILQDIEALDATIQAKGHLGIWNYNQEE